jgi:hypothetical protein
MVTSLRTRKTYEEYNEIIAERILENGCALCRENKDELIKEFKHWKIIENKFPWDLIAKTNHLIIPKRHVIYEELNSEEKEEFDLIKSEHVEKGYELMAEALVKSVPKHFHIHLIILKDRIGE